MTDPINISIRCGEETRRAWKKACGAFDLTYAEMAFNVANFVLENEEQFRRFVYEEDRKRE